MLTDGQASCWPKAHLILWNINYKPIKTLSINKLTILLEVVLLAETLLGRDHAYMTRQACLHTSRTKLSCYINSLWLVDAYQSSDRRKRLIEHEVLVSEMRSLYKTTQCCFYFVYQCFHIISPMPLIVYEIVLLKCVLGTYLILFVFSFTCLLTC